MVRIKSESRSTEHPSPSNSVLSELKINIVLQNRKSNSISCLGKHCWGGVGGGPLSICAGRTLRSVFAVVWLGEVRGIESNAANTILPQQMQIRAPGGSFGIGQLIWSLARWHGRDWSGGMSGHAGESRGCSPSEDPVPVTVGNFYNNAVDSWEEHKACMLSRWRYDSELYRIILIAALYKSLLLFINFNFSLEM